MRCILPACLLLTSWTAPALGHDIPNAQVDRSIQATLRPGRLEIAYEVSLAELTLTQDLRDLIGPLPGGDRAAWFDLYGRETGPLNARGLLVSVDGRPLDLRCGPFDLVVEGHPRFTFRFDAPLPLRGRLRLQDTNFVSSEGTSRLAVRGLGGVSVRGDPLPPDVSSLPIRPVWQLSDAEERRTKQVEVTFAAAPPGPLPGPLPPSGKSGEVGRPAAGPRPEPPRLSSLLGPSGIPIAWLGLLAFGLGMAHAIQPGHGKTLVAASVVGRAGGAWRGVALALIVTVVHVGAVLAVAAALWATRTTRYAEIDRGLARCAGFTVAAIGLWRLGRHLAGHGEHDPPDAPPAPGDRGLLGLGLAGGLVPCWDAILLLILAEALGRLSLGLALLVAFSLGMACVLVSVGLLASRLRGVLDRRPAGPDWSRLLGLASGLALTAIGLSLLSP